MHTLLQLNTSLYNGRGESTRLASQFVDRFRARHPDARVIERDLVHAPVPHLTAETFQAFGTPAAARSAEQQAAVTHSDALIEELKIANTIVLGLPMYNFGVPSQLKQSRRDDKRLEHKWRATNRQGGAPQSVSVRAPQTLSASARGG